MFCRWEVKLKIQSRKVQFSGYDDNLLSGIVESPLGDNAKKMIIVSHCFTCTKQIITTARLSRGLAQAGFAVLRFDFSGLGDSEGQFADSNFSSMIKDTQCAAEFLANNFVPVDVLIGHSMGGVASLAVAQNNHASLSGVKKLITLASPAEPSHVLHHFDSALVELNKGRSANIVVAGQKYLIKPQFIDDVMSYNMKNRMQACNQFILAISAGNDKLIEPQAAQQIIDYTHGDAQVYVIDGADHLFSNKRHSEMLLSVVIKSLI